MKSRGAVLRGYPQAATDASARPEPSRLQAHAPGRVEAAVVETPTANDTSSCPRGEHWQVRMPQARPGWPLPGLVGARPRRAPLGLSVRTANLWPPGRAQAPIACGHGAPPPPAAAAARRAHPRQPCTRNPTPTNPQVHKFGGTCVASAQRISDIADYLLATDPAGHKLVVVSAMGAHPDSPLKVTDLLINMVAKASRQDEAFLLDLAALQVRAGVRGVGRGWRALCLLARPGGAAGAPQLPSARAWV